MKKLKQTKQQIDWTDWKKLKNPFWYQRITDALPIYNKYNEAVITLLDHMGQADKKLQETILKKIEAARLDAIKRVDMIDHKFLNDLYQARTLYLANQKGFKPEKFAEMLKAILKPKRKTQKKKRKK